MIKRISKLWVGYFLIELLLPRSMILFAKNLESGLLPPYTNMTRMERVGVEIIKTEGIYFYTKKNHQIIDGSSSLFTNGTGHSREEFVREISKNLKTLDFVPLYQGLTHPLVLTLVKKLQEITPGNLNSVYFSNSGSEAVDTAMKLSMQIHNAHGEESRRHFVSLNGAFHGSNMGGTAIGMRTTPFQGALTPTIHKIPGLSYKETFFKGRPNDGAHKAFALEKLVADLAKKKEKIAAVFVEPIQGAAGIFYPGKGYLENLRKICDKDGIHLIFDEILAGMGRTGSYFSYQDVSDGIHPDMILMGKSLTNGIASMGATIIRSDYIQDLLEHTKNECAITHGHTGSGNPVVVTAALTQFEIYEKENILENVKKMEEFFSNELLSLRDLQIIRGIRSGIGLLGAIDLDEKEIKERDIQDELVKAGAFFKYTHPGTIIVTPPLVITQIEIQKMVKIIREVLSR